MSGEDKGFVGRERKGFEIGDWVELKKWGVHLSESFQAKVLLEWRMIQRNKGCVCSWPIGSVFKKLFRVYLYILDVNFYILF